MVCIAYLKTLSLNCGKKNERTRPKDEYWDCVYWRTHLKFDTWIWNVVAVKVCEKAIAKQGVEPTERILGLKCEIWPWIEVGQSRKKIGEVRRSMIAVLGNKNDWLLI